MPVKVREINGKFRLVEGAGEAIAKNKKGTPIDGGGHKSKEQAQKQASAINTKQDAMTSVMRGRAARVRPSRGAK